MSIEALKEQARQHEQWEKALDLYSRAIDQMSEGGDPDVGLFNRSGDLATRIGRQAQAVTFYEKAVDFYVAAGLPNNAIAICKKVMRNLPDRYSIHLKMGQIRAAQGLVTEARSSFVLYGSGFRPMVISTKPSGRWSSLSSLRLTTTKSASCWLPNSSKMGGRRKRFSSSSVLTIR